jgi:hypothetical protein
MNYKVTSQYARGEEKLIAEFYTSQDVNFFLTKKIGVDQSQAKQQMYRLYGDSELLQAFNPENISVAYAQYADGNSDFIIPPLFLYHVTIQINDALESKNIASFNDISDVNLFIIVKCETDSAVNDTDLFGIFKDKVLIKTLNRIIIAHQKMASESAKGKGDQSMATFYPTPTPKRPLPPGGPSDCWIEKEED